MKAILIINKPTECVDCPCAIESEGSYWCNAKCKDVTAEAYEGIPKWCPLKPCPERLPQDMYVFESDALINATNSGYVRGWNDCVEVIENEQNDS